MERTWFLVHKLGFLKMNYFKNRQICRFNCSPNLTKLDVGGAHCKKKTSIKKILPQSFQAKS